VQVIKGGGVVVAYRWYQYCPLAGHMPALRLYVMMWGGRQGEMVVDKCEREDGEIEDRIWAGRAD
jgi:hypothetical protein